LKKFGLIVNEEKDAGCSVANVIKSYLENSENCVTIFNYKEKFSLDEDTDMALVLGGDGTVIQVAKKIAGCQIPILGINLGTLGFLTEVEKPRMYQALDMVLSNRYTIERRMVLSGTLGTEKEKNLAINEIIVGKKDIGRMITTSVWVNDELMDTYVADGVIVSTPTGSTAYNLSAGGPVLSPHMEALVITPICPHSLNKRSLVVSSEGRIRIQVEKTRESHVDEASVRCDGENIWNAQTGDVIHIQKAKEAFDVVCLGDVGFYEKMRSKLNRN
jgi:NAD+ kinase